MTAEQSVLYKRCDEVLHYLWDPIGVSDAPGARDEYEPYLPQVFELLVGGAGRDEIVDFLAAVETKRMGMESDRVRATKAASVLIEWREWVNEGGGR